MKLYAIAAGILAGCAGAPTTSAPTSSTETRPIASVTPPVDVGRALAEVRLAYHREGGGFVAGGPGYGVDVAAGGSFRLHPIARRSRNASAVRGAPISIETVAIGRGAAAAGPSVA